MDELIKQTICRQCHDTPVAVLASATHANKTIDSHDESQQRSDYDLRYYESFILHVLCKRGAAIAACQNGLKAPQA